MWFFVCKQDGEQLFVTSDTVTTTTDADGNQYVICIAEVKHTLVSTLILYIYDVMSLRLTRLSEYMFAICYNGLL